jgi:hypothetical protein
VQLLCRLGPRASVEVARPAPPPAPWPSCRAR